MNTYCYLDHILDLSLNLQANLELIRTLLVKKLVKSLLTINSRLAKHDYQFDTIRSCLDLFKAAMKTTKYEGIIGRIFRLHIPKEKKSYFDAPCYIPNVGIILTH